MASPLSQLRPRVDAELTDFVARRRAQLLDIGPELEPLLEALEALLAGGKRLRPAFCYWGWRGAGGADTAPIHRAAASLEFLQACALVHDDVIDNSDTRRGEPAAHRRLAALHTASEWTGPARHFGHGAAILLGDLCLVWCDEMYSSSGLSDVALRAGREPLDTMRTEVMAGQYLDMVEQARGGESVEAALRVMHYKAAKYTVQRPLHLGAALAGRYRELEPVYTAYGRALGLAFQLRDDILGVFGTPEETGKPAGDDLREGKRTVLVAETMRLASTGDAAAFRGLLGDPHLKEEQVEWMRGVITGSGALRACEDRITAFAAEATAALDTDLLTTEANAALRELVVAATRRRS